jgi:hypothetical protein
MVKRNFSVLNDQKIHKSSFLSSDNYFYEAYPNVAYERLKPIFKSMNISLTVRNHAIGNNPCYAYDACIATHLGDDLDIVGWEQSMNCGRDPRPLDTFTRQTEYMKRKVKRNSKSCFCIHKHIVNIFSFLK